jgi:8-oxo-dGTP pyrophosphatase MutT (NUDIX family)
MWEKIKTRTIFKHPRITLVEDQVKLPNKSVVPYLRFVEKNKASVTIICIDSESVLVQHEYSYPTNEILYQFPGGKVEKKENIKTAAKREIFEESGIKPKKIKEIGWYYSNNRRSNLKMHVFIVKKFVLSKKTGGDVEENIESEWLSITEINNLIAKGKIVNYSFLAAWALFQNQL